LESKKATTNANKKGGFGLLEEQGEDLRITHFVSTLWKKEKNLRGKKGCYFQLIHQVVLRTLMIKEGRSLLSKVSAQRARQKRREGGEEIVVDEPECMAVSGFRLEDRPGWKEGAVVRTVLDREGRGSERD